MVRLLSLLVVLLTLALAGNARAQGLPEWLREGPGERGVYLGMALMPVDPAAGSQYAVRSAIVEGILIALHQCVRMSLKLPEIPPSAKGHTIKTELGQMWFTSFVRLVKSKTGEEWFHGEVKVRVPEGIAAADKLETKYKWNKGAPEERQYSDIDHACHARSRCTDAGIKKFLDFLGAQGIKVLGAMPVLDGKAVVVGLAWDPKVVGKK
jgi:hypothetical protein